MMNLIWKVLTGVGMMLSTSVSAHLMVAEHGTLNFDDTGAYVVVSIASSNFPEADSDKNGMLSLSEFQKAKTAIFSEVLSGIYMMEGEQKKSISGLMLSPQGAHHNEKEDIDQIVLMGKFLEVDHEKGLTFHNHFYGADEHSHLEMTAKYKRLGLKQAFVLTTNKKKVKVF